MTDLLILHGAIGSPAQLAAIAESIRKNHHVHTLDFTGHGNALLANEPFSISLFANDVLRFLEAKSLSKISILGYSMGGYVAMYLAKYHPDKVNKIITLATKFHWDELIAAQEVLMLDPDKIELKLPAFAATLKARHVNDWKHVLRNTAEMMVAMGADNPLKLTDYSSILHPTLLLLGDRDKMVTIEETTAFYKALPNAQMGLLPNTPHPIEQVDKELFSFMVERFIKG